MQLPDFKSPKEFFETIQGLLEIGQFPGTLAVDVAVATAHVNNTIHVLNEQEKNEQAKAAGASEEESPISSDRSKEVAGRVGSGKAPRRRRKNSKD